MKIMLHSANLGGFDRIEPPVEQSLSYEFHCFTDSDFPPRKHSLSPRLQARIPKMFGWDMLPGYDIYIWLDSSYRLCTKNAIRWFVSNLGYCDLAIFRHPKRKSIAEEASFIANKIEKQSPYLTGRYEGEDIEGQLRAIRTDGFVDDCLYATMAFAYCPNYRVKRMLTDWWVHTSRFHSVDQLALPYLVWDHSCSVAILTGDPYHSPWIEYVRGDPRA